MAIAKKIIIPLLLIIPVLYFTLPVVALGTSSLRLIGHFDMDEGIIIDFMAKTYSQGIVPLKFECSWPQFYPYLAGIFLFPFTFFKGIDYQVIAIVLRSFNILVGILTAVFLYFFCLRFFKSVFIGVLSSLLFITTPDYLGWLVNSRPHPLEILFILITFYYCLQAIEQYQQKFIASAIIFAGFATATKLGGLFMLPVIWAVYLYHLTQVPVSTLANYSKKSRRLVYFFSLLIISIAVIAPLAVISLYLKFPAKFHFMGIDTFSDLLQWRDFRLAVTIGIFFFVLVLIWSGINFITNRFVKKGYTLEKYRFLFIFNRGGLVLIYLFAINIFIYLLLNPAYFLYPLNTAKIMVQHLLMTTMTSGLDPGLTKPIFDQSGLLWLRGLFFDNLILNKWFGLLFLVYLIYELLNLKKNWLNNRNTTLQRLLLSLYSFCLFLILFLFVAHQPHHYLLPIAMAIGILIPFGIVRITELAKGRFFRYFAILFFSLLIGFGFQARLKTIISDYAMKKAKIYDTGIVIGRWLEENYKPMAKIWKDSQFFYIPDNFKNVYFMKTGDSIENNFDKIKKNNPDILVITSAFDPDFGNMHKVNHAIKEGRLKLYRIKKEFRYYGPLFESGAYRKIFIYSQ